MKKTFIAGLALGAAAQVAWAQDAKPEARTPKIAVIDMARVSSESLLGKGYAAQLEALQNEINSEGTKKQSELQKLDAAIKTLQDELEKQASVLSPEAAEKKRQDIVRKGRERQAFLEDGQAELQRMRETAQGKAQSLNNEFQTRIKPHIDAVAKEKGIDIILDAGVALTANKDFDISRDVIVKADDAEKAAKGAAAAAKPSGPAPAPAPAKPAPPPPSKP
jgi:Skp family chaperone for outer membrane proteins